MGWVDGRNVRIETAAATLDITPVQAAVRDGPEIESAIEAFAGEPGGGLLALPGSAIIHSELIIALAAPSRSNIAGPSRSTGCRSWRASCSPAGARHRHAVHAGDARPAM